jgi:uridine kinase
VPVLIVDGLFVSRPERQALVDLSILVDAPAGIRRRRQINRADASSEWLERGDAAERTFFQRTRPPRSFDIIVHRL